MFKQITCFAIFALVTAVGYGCADSEETSSEADSVVSATSVSCPSEKPRAGHQCRANGVLSCTYGDDLMRCRDNRWESVGTGGGAQPCPAVEPEAGKQCRANGVYNCEYGDSVLSCRENRWVSVGTGGGAQPCPAAEPVAGRQCRANGVYSCTYDDSVLSCRENRWVKL